MAMALPTDDNNNIPSPVSSLNEQSNQQLEEQNQPSAATSTQQQKRKPSRRANTAERRATHNAVERQRRETLNGRFLDLAALLPNLSQIRRPSKSSIVNSSIAHVHASRRHRLLAARELRQLKQEADALRRELNEWRDRAQIPRIEEPVRSDGFSMVLSAELEVIAAVPGDGDDEDGYDGEGGNDGGYGGAYMDDIEEEQYAVPAQQQLQEMEDPRVAAMLKNANPFAQSVPSPVTATGLAHLLPRPSMVGPYDNPLALYEQAHHAQQQQQQPQHPAYPNQGQFVHDHQEKMHWNNMYPSQHQQQHIMHHPQQQLIQAQRSLYTPPASAHDHGLPSPPRSTGSGSVSPPHHSSSTIAFEGDAATYAFSGPSQPVQRRRSSGSSGTGSGYTGSYGGSPVYAESPTGQYTGSPTGYAGTSSGYGGSYTGSPPGDSPSYELALGQADYGVAVPRRGYEMGVGMQQQQAVVGGMMM